LQWEHIIIAMGTEFCWQWTYSSGCSRWIQTSQYCHTTKQYKTHSYGR